MNKEEDIFKIFKIRKNEKTAFTLKCLNCRRIKLGKDLEDNQFDEELFDEELFDEDDYLIVTGIGYRFAPQLFENPPSVEPNNWDLVESEVIRNEVDDLLVNKKAKFITDLDDDYAYGMRVYYSKKEMKIYNLLDFRIEYIEDNKKVVYRPPYKDSFGENLILLDNDEVENVPVKCPKCGKIIYAYEEIGICWD